MHARVTSIEWPLGEKVEGMDEASKPCAIRLCRLLSSYRASTDPGHTSPCGDLARRRGGERPERGSAGPGDRGIWRGQLTKAGEQL
jgi:hypothetical protein